MGLLGLKGNTPVKATISSFHESRFRIGSQGNMLPPTANDQHTHDIIQSQYRKKSIISNNMNQSFQYTIPEVMNENFDDIKQTQHSRSIIIEQEDFVDNLDPTILPSLTANRHAKIRDAPSKSVFVSKQNSPKSQLLKD